MSPMELLYFECDRFEIIQFKAGARRRFERTWRVRCASPGRHGGLVYVADGENGLALAAQEPWIQHASVRDNILFGKSYDAAFYRAVVEACALADDLAVRCSPHLQTRSFGQFWRTIHWLKDWFFSSLHLPRMTTFPPFSMKKFFQPIHDICSCSKHSNMGQPFSPHSPNCDIFANSNISAWQKVGDVFQMELIPPHFSTYCMILHSAIPTSKGFDLLHRKYGFFSHLPKTSFQDLPWIETFDKFDRIRPHCGAIPTHEHANADVLDL